MEPDKQAGTRGGGSLSDSGRRQALDDAGWQPDGTDAPKAADAWAVYKQRARAAADAWAIYKQRSHAAADAWAVFYTQRARSAVSMQKPRRYVVLLGGDGQPPHLFDTETNTTIMSYPTVREAERQATLLNRLIHPGLAPTD